MRILRKFLSEKALELYMGIVLGFIMSAILLLLGNRPDLMLISALALFFLLIAFAWVKEKMESSHVSIGQLLAFKVPRRGIIFTLGLRSSEPSSVVYLVNKVLAPEFVGLLGTPETQNVIKDILAELKLQEGKCKTETWNLTEINEGKIKTSLVIDWMLAQGLKEEEVVVDLTGGTTAMSIAAFMAAEDRKIDCQYIQSKYDEAKNIHIKGSQKPILITGYNRSTPIEQ
jgi:hypothetical protein